MLILVLIQDLVATGPTELTTVILLYAGPDQILPLVSFLGAIIGVLLIWWQRFVTLAKKGWRLLTRRAAPSSAEKVEAAPNKE